MEIAVPADSIKADVQLFNGNTGQHENLVNWTVDKENAPVGLILPGCLSCVRAYWLDTPLISPQPLFFNRIGRIGNVVCGLFSEKMRVKNRIYREEERAQWIRYRQNIKDTFWIQKPLDTSKDTACKELLALYQKYRVYADTSLIKVMNVALLKKYNVWSYSELCNKIVMLEGLMREKGLLQNKITLKEYSYYLFSTVKLGWLNLDKFAKYSPGRLTRIQVNLKADSSTVCKMVLKKRKIIVNAYEIDGQWVRNVSIDELRAELRKLDQ